jgi:very-short-patch-repair endonuclease
MRGRDLERPFRGVRVASAGGGADYLARCEAYAARMTPGQVFSHATAALLWDMPLPARVEHDPVIHVSAIGGGTRPRIRGVVGHELSDPRIRSASRKGVPVTDAATSWVQLAGILGVDDLVAAGDNLVLRPRRQVADDPRPHASIEELSRRLAAYRGPGRRAAMTAVSLIREGAESARETALRLHLLRAGLPEPRLQGRIEDSRGRFIAYGDLVYPEFRVLVEYDGQQHRTDSQQYHADIRRHDALLAGGWIHIRVDKHTPSAGAESAPARAIAALRSRGWRP